MKSMVQEMVVTSKVNRASSRSPSVRTTVPEEMAALLGVKVGDVLIWREEICEGRKGAFIRKAE